jgi:hypothetical protein
MASLAVGIISCIGPLGGKHGSKPYPSGPSQLSTFIPEITHCKMGALTPSISIIIVHYSPAIISIAKPIIYEVMYMLC